VADPNGHPATLWDRLSGTGNGNGAVVVQNNDGTLLFQMGSGTSPVGSIQTTATTLSNNRWHQVAVVNDQANGQVLVYVDGQSDTSVFMSTPASLWQPGQELELGLSHDTNSWQAYIGEMDDVRFYNRALSGSEVTSAYGGALVDTNALVMQLNFTTAPGPGLALTWSAPGAVLQSADSVTGPYTDLPGAASPYNVSVQQTAKFYRYRTQHTPAVVIANPYLM
jgi:Concanavalin A-like lectin/glucanases superfamily